MTDTYTIPCSDGTFLTVRKRDTFQSPYDEYANRIGDGFEVLGEVPHGEFDFEEVGAVYTIRFDDGEEITAWPEEIFCGLIDDDILRERGKGD